MLINYVHVEPSAHKVHFFSQIDLSDLISLVKWHTKHTISSISEIYEADFSRDFTWDFENSLELNQALLNQKIGEPFDFFSVEGSQRPPVRAKSNLKLIDVMEFSKETDTFDEFQSVLDLHTKKVNFQAKVALKNFPTPAFYPDKNASKYLMIKYKGEPDPSWVKEGVYINGELL